MNVLKQPWCTMFLCMGALLPAACEDEPEDDESLFMGTVDTDINATVDFAVYTTFDIADPMAEGGGEAPPASYAEIRDQLFAAIDHELTEAGLTRSADNPSVIVSPFIAVDPTAQDVEFYDGYYGWYYGYEYSWTTTVTYDVGTLLLDVVDRRATADVVDDLLVYRGVAQGLLSQDIAVAKLQIRNATHAIFEDWPTSTP